MRKIDPVIRFLSKIDKPDENGCTNWKDFIDKRGYGRLTVNGKSVKPHRFAYALHYGSIPKGMYVCHKCDNPSCVNIEHLFIGNQFDNMQDMIKKGRKAVLKGEQLAESKLNKDKILKIKLKVETGIPVKDVAKEFGISKEVIYGIASNKGWKHLKIEIKIPRHKRFKLDKDKVIEIKNDLSNGWTVEYLANKFGVARNSIVRIKNGKGWKNV